MLDKKINSPQPSNRRQVSKSLIPLRNSVIKSGSTNQSSFCAQLAGNQNHAKIPMKPLTYFLGKGNNEALIRKVMSHRAVWEESEDSTSAFINLKWRQDQKGYRYNRLVESGLYRNVVNHFEFHQNLSNKEFLFKNLQKFCHKNQKDLWRIVPPTFILNSKDECCMQALKLFFDYYSKFYPKPLKERKTASEVEKQIYDERRKLRNYFFNCNLKKNLPKNPPMLDVFLDKQNGDYLWIVKPTFLNRGRGIQVFSKLTDLSKFVSENINGYVEKKVGEHEAETNANKSKGCAIDYVKRNTEVTRISAQKQAVQTQLKQRKQMDEEDEQPVFDGNQFIRVIPNGPVIIKTDCFLIQKYLQRPMLIKNHKFDVRMWVLVTHQMKGYVFPEGYIRLSSFQYTCKDSKGNSFIHLTNNAIQKFSEDYGKVAQGNQMSFQILKEIMHEEQFRHCQTIIYGHIRDSLNATIGKLNSNNRKYAFEIFGYDFMIDESGFPWLIEVNTNPCLDESSQILKKLLPRMLDDAFKLTIDTLFYGSVSNADFPVEGYSKANMWVNLQIENAL